jgi:hypothetical protein
MILELSKYLAEEELAREREKTSFWATDSEKPLFDLYHQWKGTKPTNPIEPKKLIMFQAAKMLEMAMVDKLVAMGKAQKLEQQARIDFQWEDVPITGYVDALEINSDPIEIKSFYGEYQAKELQEGKPKTSYLKQLAIYMYFLGKKRGTLIYLDRGTGDMYEFELVRLDDFTFQSGNIKFDLRDVFKRWKDLYANHILPSIEPKSEYLYKLPISSINWSSLSKADISKARTNQKVIGSHPWAVNYSPYKNMIIEREGTTLGYTDEELNQIKELTKGYSAKPIKKLIT